MKPLLIIVCFLISINSFAGEFNPNKKEVEKRLLDVMQTLLEGKFGSDGRGKIKVIYLNITDIKSNKNDVIVFTAFYQVAIKEFASGKKGTFSANIEVTIKQLMDDFAVVKIYGANKYGEKVELIYPDSSI